MKQLQNILLVRHRVQFSFPPIFPSPRQGFLWMCPLFLSPTNIALPFNVSMISLSQPQLWQQDTS